MFKIIQLFWGAVPYFQHAEAINREYCRRHSYDYEVLTPPAGEDIFRLNYYRASAAIPELNAMPEPGDEPVMDSGILYMDADAYFVNLDRSLDDIMKVYFQDNRTAIMFAEHALDSKRRWSGTQVNCGVFLARPHEKSIPILDRWWKAWGEVKPQDREDLTDAQRYRLLNDQEVFNRIVLPEFREHVNIVRNPEFGGYDGEFIRHLMLLDNIEREQRLEKDRQRLGL